MSERDDDLFARWSRRKSAARTREARISDEAAPADGKQEAEAIGDRMLPATVPAEPTTPTKPAAGEPPEPLPSLEDITADGDLTAFLRKDVPTALKNAAMRKMWSLDPAIRDHVGPAEYAWDFNQQGAMRGFGPLSAGKSVADFLSTAGREALSNPEEPPLDTSAPPPEQPIGLGAEQGVDDPAQHRVASEGPRQATTEAPTTPDKAEASRSADSAPTPGRRHGGTLPR